MESAAISEINQPAAEQNRAKHWLKRFGFIFGMVLILEIFVCNSSYWSFDSDAFQYREMPLPYNQQIGRNAVVLTKQNPQITLSDVDTMISTIKLEAYGGYLMSKGAIFATSKTQKYNYQKISDFKLASGISLDIQKPAQEHQKALIKFDLQETVSSILISFDQESLTTPIIVTKIQLNVQPVFSFSVVRVVLMMLGLSLLYITLFSKLYQHTLTVDSRAYKLINRGMCVLAMLFSLGVLLAYHPSFTTSTGFKLVSLGFLPYNTPNHTLLQEIPQTQEELGDVDIYIEQMHAFFIKHQLNLDLWVDPKLLTLDYVYDSSERHAKDAKYYLDRAFYDGKYYCYFGLAPIILIYTPIYLITGLVPSPVLAAFIAALYALLGLHLLSSRLTSLVCDKCNTTLFVVTKLTMYMCSFVFLLQTLIVFYLLPYLTCTAAVGIAISCALGLLQRTKQKSKHTTNKQAHENVTEHTNEILVEQSNDKSHGLSQGQSMLSEEAYKEETPKESVSKEVVSKDAARRDAARKYVDRKDDGSWSADLASKENIWSKVTAWLRSSWQGFWQVKTSEQIPFAWDYKTMFSMVLCGLCVVLVVMSRPAVLIHVIFGVGICYLLYVMKVQQSVKTKVINSLCLMVPVLIGAVIVSWFNYARFDSIFEFGQFRQLTGDDNLGNPPHITLAFFKTFVFNVLFSNLELRSSFPFVDMYNTKETQLGQYVYMTDRFGLFTIPFYWGLLLLPLCWKLKQLSNQSTARLLPPLEKNLALRALQVIISSWYLSTFIILFITAFAAGWSIRYIVDATCVLTVLPLIFGLMLKFNWESDIERIFYLAWIWLCVLSSVLMFFLLFNTAQTKLEVLNPRLFLICKDIFDPFNFS